MNKSLKYLSLLFVLFLLVLDIISIRDLNAQEFTSRFLLILIGGIIYLFFQNLMARISRERREYNQKLIIFGACLIILSILNFLVFDNSEVLGSVASAKSAPGIEWQKSLGGSDTDYVSSIQQTSDSGYIIAGSSESTDGDVTENHGDQDYWIVKLDTNGDIEWKKCLGGSGRDRAYSIQQTSDNGYIVAGYTTSNDGDVTGNHGLGDAWIVKLDTNGGVEWKKCIGGSNNDQVNSIQQTSDGGYIFAGQSFSNDGDVTGYPQDGYWVVKLDTNGNILWQKFGGDIISGTLISIQQTSDRGYIGAGETNSDHGDVTGKHGNSDYLIVKLDTNGDIQWHKYLGGSELDASNSIQQTSDGGYIVSGRVNSNDYDVTGNHGERDYWIVKLDTNGDIEWKKCIGGSNTDTANHIQQTSDGGYIVAGETYSTNGDVTGNHGDRDYWIVKLKKEGV